VSRIQNLRKDSGLQVTDRIQLSITCDGDIKKAVTAHRSYIMGETLGVSQEFVGEVTVPHKVVTDIDGVHVVIGLAKA
jgi:isoleucyl-tRNA synthetase